MTVPTCFADSVAFQRLPACTDMTDLETAFWALAQTLTNPWTSPSANTYKTPVDASGRWFDLVWAEQSATRMDINMRDPAAGTIVQGRFDKIATAVIDIYIGEHFYHIDCFNAAMVAEFAWGGMLDLSPESQTYYSQYYVGNTTRDTANANRANIHCNSSFYWNGSAYALSNQIPWTIFSCRGGCPDTPYSCLSGAPLFSQLFSSAGTALNYSGRFYDHLWGPVGCPPGTEITVPIDNGVNRTFRRCGMTSNTGSCQYNWYIKVA